MVFVAWSFSTRRVENEFLGREVGRQFLRLVDFKVYDPTNGLTMAQLDP